MSKSGILVMALAALTAATSAFAAALLFVPGFDAAIRWRLHLEDRGYGSFGERLHRDHLLKDIGVGDGRIVVIGDSHAAALDQSRLGPLAVNFGIGGETMLGVAERMPKYRAAQTARAIILIAGYNDLRYREPAEVLASFEEVRAQAGETPLYTVSVMPVRDDEGANKKIAETDALLGNACTNACRYIDVATEFSALSDEERTKLYLDDGIHLTPSAYDRVIAAITHALCADGVYGAGGDVCS